MAMSKAMNGQGYLRALSYAAKAAPRNQQGARLQHVSFIEDKVIGADGERWHVGMLGEVDLPPTAVALQSIDSLLMALEYAQRMSRRQNGDFTVRQSGTLVVIEYGARHPIEHQLAMVDVGPGALPTKWKPPVASNAPILGERGHGDIRCGHMRDAMSWYRSWDVDHGTYSMRGNGGSEPVRIDIAAKGDLVASAFLLPADHPPAQLPPDEPLLAGKGKARSQSNLDLDVNAPAPSEKSASEKPVKNGGGKVLTMTGKKGKPKAPKVPKVRTEDYADSVDPDDEG